MSTRTAFADATAGVAGSLVALLAFYPIDVIKTNLQAHGRKHKDRENDEMNAITRTNTSTRSSTAREENELNVLTLLHKMFAEQPSTLHFLKSLFRGLHFKIAHTTASSFAYFFIYSWIQSKHRLYITSKNSGTTKSNDRYQPSTSIRLLLSAIAAMVNTTLTLPLDVLAARRQTDNRPSEESKQCAASEDNEKDVERSRIECMQDNLRDEKQEVDEKKEDYMDYPCITADSKASTSANTQELMKDVWKNVNQFDTEDSETDYDTANEEQDHSRNGSDDEDSANIDECQKEQEPLDYCSSFDDEDDKMLLEQSQTESDQQKSELRTKTSTLDTNGDALYVRPLFRVDTMTQPFPKQLVYTLSLLNKSKRTDLHKLAELWSGIRPSLLLCSNPSIHFTVFDSMKDVVLKHKTDMNARLSMGEAFCIGLVAKFAATMVTYPLIRAKVMLMVAKKEKVGSESTTSEDTMIGLLQGMYQNGGTKEMYKGCKLQLVHALLKSALLMMVKERIAVTTKRLILG